MNREIFGRYAWLLDSIYKNGKGWWNDFYNLLWFKLGWKFGQKQIDYWICHLFFRQCNSKFGAINNNLQWCYLQLKLNIWQLVKPLDK
jgi:hypothetical protein